MTSPKKHGFPDECNCASEDICQFLQQREEAAAPSQALPVAAPYGWIVQGTAIFSRDKAALEHCQGCDLVPLYAGSPPTARPLTEKKIEKLWAKSVCGIRVDVQAFARAIESAHGIVAAPTGGDRG